MTARVAPAVFCEQPERRVQEAAPYRHPNPRETGGPVCRPYGESGPQALARQSQAQLWNRMAPEFL